MSNRRIEVGADPRGALKAYGALAVRNAGAIQAADKLALSREMYRIFAQEFSGERGAAIDGLAITAADVTDINLGTLAGTLVAQKALELYKFEYPILSRISTDYSDIPAQFGQTVMVRIITVPAVMTYSPANGWVVVTPAKTVDVPVILDEHIGVQIEFDANTLASTVRRLFEEQAPAASYSLATYFVNKVYALLTPANFNAYAVKGAKVPNVYPTYAVSLGDFARSALTKVKSAFNTNEVPKKNRSLLLNSDYHSQLSQDPSLVYFTAVRAPEMVEEGTLPRMAGFLPIEAPNLPSTNNMAGLALHKSALVTTTRLPNDYTSVLPGSSYGKVTTVTNEDIGISVMLVQYVDHNQGKAKWRIAAMIGAGMGDKRGGLLLTQP
jgi:hypothetical protein